MASTIDIKFIGKDLVSGVVKDIRSALQDLGGSAVSGSLNIVKTGISSIISVAKTAAIATTGLLTALGGAALKSAADFESMDVALTTAFQGNKVLAEQAGKAITTFAAKTPYELEEVMRGFIKLKNMGLDPSEKALTAYGDTASAMGKSLNDMVEAVADAATGEFERLKEFGIRASSEGDKVKFTFQGITTTVGKNSKEIEEYLIRLGQTKFTGGMEAQSRTLKGLLSTLKDNVNLTLASIAENTGLLDFAKSTVSALGEMANGIRAAVSGSTEELTGFADVARDAFFGVSAIIQGFINNDIGALFDGLQGIGISDDIMAEKLSTILMAARNVLVSAFASFQEMFGVFIGYIRDNWPQIQSVILGVFNQVVTNWNTILKPVLMTIMQTFAEVVGWVASNWPRISEIIAQVYNTISVLVNTILIPAFNQTVEWVHILVQTFLDNWPKISQVVSQVVTTAIQIWNTLWPVIKFGVGVIIETIQTLLPIILNVISWFFNMKDNVVSAVMQAKDWVINAFSTVRNFISSVVGEIGAIVSSGFAAFKNTAVSIASELRNGVVNVFTGLKDTVTGIVGSIRNAIVMIFTMVKDDTFRLFDTIKDKIVGTFNSIVNAIKSAFNSLLNIGGNLWDAIKGVINDKLIRRFNEFQIKIPLGIKTIHQDLPDLPYLAKGGSVSQAGMAIVGEKGPEAVMLPKGAEVVSNRPTEQMLNNSTDSKSPTINNVTIHIDGYNGDKMDLARQIQGILGSMNQNTQLGLNAGI